MQLVSAGFLCLFAAAAMTLLINQDLDSAKAAETSPARVASDMTPLAH